MTVKYGKIMLNREKGKTFMARTTTTQFPIFPYFYFISLVKYRNKAQHCDGIINELYFQFITELSAMLQDNNLKKETFRIINDIAKANICNKVLL